MSSKRKKIRLLSLIWDYTSALSLIALLILLWHLGKGPIEVNFLRPYIIEALTNETSSYDLNVGKVNLELVHSIQPVKIIAKDVSFKSHDETYLIKAPRLSLSFSTRALLKGMLAPSTINIENPIITLAFSYGLKQKQQDKNETHQNTSKKLEEEQANLSESNLKKLEFYFTQFEDFLQRFDSKEHLYLESFINEINIENATVSMTEKDLGKQILFADTNFAITRGLTDINISADTALQFKDRTSGLDMNLNYRLLNGELNYNLNFSDLIITDLYNIFVINNTDIRTVDIPINGKFNAIIDFENILKNKNKFADNLGNNIKEIAFEIEGGKGKIGFGPSDEYDYNVSSFNLKGDLHGGLDTVTIKDAMFDFDGKKAELSATAFGFKDYFLKGDIKNFKFNFTANIDAFDMNELSTLWPKYLGQKAWSWCKESLYGGNISKGSFTFNFGYDEKNKIFDLLSLQGTADVSDANLKYLDGMPIVKNVYGRAHFSSDKIDIKVDKGTSDGVILTGGNVLLYDLDKEDNFIKINLLGNSTITDALLLIDNEPLGFTKEMGIDPKSVNGDIDIVLGLDFELKSDLKPEEIKVNVLGKLKEVEYLGLKDNKTFTADNLNLNVTEKGFELKGTAKYQNIPLDLDFKQDFNDKKHKSHLIADIKIDDNIIKALGIDSEILQAPYFTGTSDIKANIAILNDNTMEINVDGSLKDTTIDYAFLGFAKPKGIPCRVKANLIIDNDKIKTVKSFSLLKSQFQALGSINIDNKGQIKTINVSEIKSNKTFAKAKVDFSYTPALKLKVTITGDSYDLTEFFDKHKQDQNQSINKNKQKSLKDPLEDVMDTDIVISVNKLWTNHDVPVTNFAGKAELRHGIGLHRMSMVGNYGSSKDVKMKLDFVPRGNEYMLNIDSNNAGSTLKVLRLYDHMKGGNLTIEAKRDRYKNFKGYAKIRDFSLTDTPVFAKILSLSSLTGIVNMLSGEGIGFTHLNAPFSYTFSTKNLETTEAKMIGSVLGITMSGSYNLFDDSIEANGMVIPAYSLNTLIGNIPLVGKVLAGKDGTVFATNYSISGSLDKPEISINPLSTLAPNSLKELFSSEK